MEKLGTLQLNTGAACNVLRHRGVPEGATMEPNDRLLRVYRGNCQAVGPPLRDTAKSIDRLCPQTLYVAKNASTSLPGFRSCQDMDLLTVHYENIVVLDDKVDLSKEDSMMF